MRKRVVVLTYHSQNVSGMTYAANDHLALAEDLPLMGDLGFEVVSALELATCLRRGMFDSLPERCIVITMDDGSIFDYQDTPAPPYGTQESMLNILRRQHSTVLGLHLRRAPYVATAFVIASESARKQISIGMGNGEWMTETWWSAAQHSGYLDIACHSWDHVHPSVVEMNTKPDLVGAFDRIESFEEADKQIAQASRQLRLVTKSDATRLFAYPFGKTNDFLVREYLPRQKEVIAAFTTAAEPVTKQTGIWEIPRFVCGHHWRSGDELRRLLSSHT